MPTNQQGKTYEEVYGRSPSSQTPINSQTIAPTNDFQLPETQPEQTYDLSTIPVSDLMAQANQPTQTENTQNTLETRYLDAISKLSGKEVAQQSAEQSAGLPAFQSQLTDINGQIKTLQAEASAIPLRLQEQATGRGVTAGGLAPIQTAELRKNAINALSLSSVAQALQGNIALAQQQADRAVEVQFAPVEREIAFLREAMTLNEKRMGREDQKRQRQLDIVLGERERILANAKENQKIIIGWAAEASKLGNAPSLIINQALSSKDPRQALAILSPYMSDPNEKEAALLDLDFKREQIKNAQYNRYLQGEELKMAKEKLAFDKEISFANLQAEADKASIGSSKSAQTRLDAIDLTNSILNTNTSSLTGIPSLGALAPSNALAKNQINQLRSMLALEKREALKGSGPISDYESRTLNQAASSLGEEGWVRSSNLSDADFTNEVKKLRGVLTVMNGGTVNVIIRTPDGQTKRGAVNREGLNTAAQKGYTVLFE